jgi:hypothetical protein
MQEPNDLTVSDGEHESISERRTIGRSLITQKFDWAFGVGLPLICVAADPIVFNGPRSLLADYQVFAYVLSSVSIMSMAAWLLWGDRLGWLRPFLGGFFITGSVISGLVGLAILPYSLLGMFLLIGFLGFTPLFSAFVYLRSGLHALQSAEVGMEKRYVYRAAIIGALWGFTVPYVLNLYR